MGSAAVADLVERTGHEVTIGDVRPDAAAALLRRLGAPERVVRVDVDDPASLAAALDGAEVVLNATYMRHNVPVTDAAIAAGAHLVDLGSYYPETLQQLDRHAAAVRAGCRIVPGCGVAPGLTNILARLGADRLDTVESVRIYSYITHPLWTSPGIVVTRFDASSGTSLVYEGGRLAERASFGDPQRIVFPEPYGEQEVHLVPHPEPVTLPRSIDVQNVVVQGRLPGRRDPSHPGADGARVRQRRAVRRRRRGDRAASVCRRLHRPARHRRGRPQRQREAGLRRRRARRRAADAGLRLRRRAGPAAPPPRPSPARSRRSPPTWWPAAARPACTRRRPRSIRSGSWTPWPTGGWPSASASCDRPVGAQPSASAFSSANRRSSSGTSARRLGRFTTIPSCVVRASTTIVSSSGEGFSSRCGTYGGT